MTILSVNATQWVLMQNNSVERLEREIRGKIHIDITAATQCRRSRKRYSVNTSHNMPQTRCGAMHSDGSSVMDRYGAIASTT